jgi:hypothetical protein
MILQRGPGWGTPADHLPTTMNSSSPQPPPEAADVDGAADPSTLSTDDLLRQLRQDRLWLLRQIDAGRWPQWRLDLAALERELGLLLDQAAERSGTV